MMFNATFNNIWLAAGQWFSQGTPVSSTNKTDRCDIFEILLKVALNTITLKTIIIRDISIFVDFVDLWNYEIKNSHRPVAC
jgi:hypothetical protein